MKILQINKYYFLKGGAETVFFNTIELLEKNGHTVIPFTLKSKKNNASPYSSFFVDYPELSESGLWAKIKNISSFVYNKKAVKQLRKLIEKEKPDIAHIHLLFNSMSVSILPLLKKYDIPVVMTVHDYRLICPAYTFTDRKGNICEKCNISKQYWQCIAYRCSKGSIPNSTILALDSYFRKYFISPLKYINHFIFVSKFSQNKHIESASLYKTKSNHLYNFTHIAPVEKAEKKDYLFFFGRISEEKGIATLINAVSELKIQVKIAGTGPLLDKLKKQQNEYIEFIGFKSGQELTRLIQEAKFVIVPSEWYENNPLSIIEAMMLGIPVIGSNIGGIPELITDGKTGYLFEAKNSIDLKEKIAKAMSISSQEYQQMSDETIKFAHENFSPDSHYQKLIDTYQKTIKNHTK